MLLYNKPINFNTFHWPSIYEHCAAGKIVRCSRIKKSYLIESFNQFFYSEGLWKFISLTFGIRSIIILAPLLGCIQFHCHCKTSKVPLAILYNERFGRAKIKRKKNLSLCLVNSNFMAPNSMIIPPIHQTARYANEVNKAQQITQWTN